MSSGARRVTERNSLAEHLRSAILGSEHTVSSIANEAGVAPGLLSRFLSNGTDMRLSTLQKLADVLGLELCERK